MSLARNVRSVAIEFPQSGTFLRLGHVLAYIGEDKILRLGRVTRLELGEEARARVHVAHDALTCHPTPELGV